MSAPLTVATAAADWVFLELAAPVALPCEDAPCEEGPASRAFIPEGWTVRPYVVIVGGLEAEHVVQPEDGALEDRVTTLALSRFGFKGEVARGIYVESELEANAGPHGTSVWEGQAALHRPEHPGHQGQRDDARVA